MPTGLNENLPNTLCFPTTQLVNVTTVLQTHKQGKPRTMCNPWHPRSITKPVFWSLYTVFHLLVQVTNHWVSKTFTTLATSHTYLPCKRPFQEVTRIMSLPWFKNKQTKLKTLPFAFRTKFKIPKIAYNTCLFLEPNLLPLPMANPTP